MKNQCRQESADYEDDPSCSSELSFVNVRPIVTLDTTIGDYPPVKRPLHADKLLQVFEVGEQGNRESVIVLSRCETAAADTMTRQQEWFKQNAKFVASTIKHSTCQMDGANFVASYIGLLSKVALNTPGKLRDVTDEWLQTSLDRIQEMNDDARERGLIMLVTPSLSAATPWFGEYHIAPFGLVDAAWQNTERELLDNLSGACTYVKSLYWLIGGLNLFESDEEPALLSRWAMNMSTRSAEILRSVIEGNLTDFADLSDALKKPSGRSATAGSTGGTTHGVAGGTTHGAAGGTTAGAAAGGTTAGATGGTTHGAAGGTTHGAAGGATQGAAGGAVRQSTERGLAKVIGRHKIKQTLAQMSADKRAVNLLFIGLSGCGKTLIAKSFAEELGLLLMQVRPSDIITMFVGESIMRLRGVFDEAMANAPCVLFFDEVEFLAPDPNNPRGLLDIERSEDMKEFLIGLESAREKGVFVLAATNHPFNMDASVFKAGRFDRTIYVGPCDEVDRIGLFEHFTQGWTVSPELDLSDFVEALEGFSPADLRSLARECQEISTSLSKCPISPGIFRQALTSIKPSVSNQTEQRFAKFIERGYSEH